MQTWIDLLDPYLISVVIPTYNRPEYLYKCLHHVKNSTYKDLQIIVVDDGSNYKSHQMNKNIYDIYSMGTVDSKYIYLKNNTGSVSLPRNIGISHVAGRTIAPTDDDCYPQPSKFEMLYNGLWNNPNALLSYGGRLEYDVRPNGDVKFRTYANCEHIQNNKTSVGLDNGQFLYKADVYNYINPIISINACDYHLYSSFAQYGDFIFVDEPVCSYLWHGKNNSLTPKPHRVDPTHMIKGYLDCFRDGPFKDKVKTLV